MTIDRVITVREPVTLSRAADLLDVDRSVVREFYRVRKIKPKASDVQTRALLFELWEVEAALANRERRRRVDKTTATRS